MKISVLLDDKLTNYYFDPSHYQTAFDFYKGLQTNGEITAFSIVFD
jgi:hypothetical protein